jgi:hypothetical protein
MEAFCFRRMFQSAINPPSSCLISPISLSLIQVPLSVPLSDYINLGPGEHLTLPLPTLTTNTIPIFCTLLYYKLHDTLIPLRFVRGNYAAYSFL